MISIILIVNCDEFIIGNNNSWHTKWNLAIYFAFISKVGERLKWKDNTFT